MERKEEEEEEEEEVAEKEAAEGRLERKVGTVVWDADEQMSSKRSTLVCGYRLYFNFPLSVNRGWPFFFL